MGVKLVLSAVLCSVLCSPCTLAGVTILGTRIIFPSNQQAVSVQLNNPLNQPALIQAWLDNGDPKTIPKADKIPFILTPPLTRIEANKGQMIRIIEKDTSLLPKDRESIYWFNILDIPPTAADHTQKDTDVKSESVNKLQISVRSRIKLFYRPTHLAMTQEKAFRTVSFSNVSGGIKVDNPTPYYMNFFSVALNPQKENVIYGTPLMVAPFSSETFTPKIGFTPNKVTYSLINDFGGNENFTVNIR